MNTTTQYLKKALRTVENERDNFFQLAAQLEGLLDETSSSACAWAFEEGQGVTHLTREELVEAVSMRYPEGEA